jgi:hypothetical protein
MDNNTKTESTKSKTIWTHNDERTLVSTLKKAKEEGKWGDNNPKQAAWTMCARALSGSDSKSGGVPKEVDVIKRRWQCVCAHHISCFVCAFMILPSVEARI